MRTRQRPTAKWPRTSIPCPKVRCCACAERDIRLRNFKPIREEFRPDWRYYIGLFMHNRLNESASMPRGLHRRRNIQCHCCTSIHKENRYYVLMCVAAHAHTCNVKSSRHVTIFRKWHHVAISRDLSQSNYSNSPPISFIQLLSYTAFYDCFLTPLSVTAFFHHFL